MLLPGHDVKTTRQMGWDRLKNGELLAKAGDPFDAFLTIDKKLQFELNIQKIPVAIVTIHSPSNAFSELVPFGPHLQSLLSNSLPKRIHIVHVDGRVERL